MKTFLVITTAIFLTLSCNEKRKQVKPENETPKALGEASSYEIISKRGYNDLLENLYKEHAEKSGELTELAKQIHQLAESYRDSTETFNGYNGKNNEYYVSA